MDRKKLIILLLTIVCVSVATSKSAWISSVAICMFVLSSPSVVDATGECSRLDCPCASKWTKRREPESDIPQSARDTRNRTRQLLERLIHIRHFALNTASEDAQFKSRMFGRQRTGRFESEIEPETMERNKLIILLLTIIRFSFTTSKSPFTSVAVCMFVLSSPSVVDATGDDDECARWNCPCAGSKKFEMRKTVKRQTTTEANILRDARETRERTKKVLDRITSERFKNPEHAMNMESCVQDSDRNCLNLYLLGRCHLEGFPLLHQIQNASRIDDTSFDAFMRDTRTLLSSLAVYVEQAREDEDRRVEHYPQSLADDIQLIEDHGIYQILCSLQIAAIARDIPWDATVASGGMLLGCETIESRAAIDDRNYIVFYTLQKILDQIGRQTNDTETMRKRNGWVVADPPQSPLYLQAAAGNDESEGNGGNDSVDDSKDGIVAQKERRKLE